jgi:predicted Zn-dependent protease
MSDLIVAQAYEHLRFRRYDQAFAIVRRGLERDPGNLKLIEALAQVAVQADKPDIALFALEQARKKMPWNSRILMLSGEIEFRRERWDAAEQFFRQAHALEPLNPNTGRSVCIALYRADKVDEAISFARQLFATRSIDD